MKIFIRPDAEAPSEWPQRFVPFLKKNSECIEQKNIFALCEGTQITVPHGDVGAKVIFTVGSYLPDSWKVAAFHSNLVSELISFDSNQLARADGIVVSGKNFTHPLGIATADCLAVAVTSESLTEVSAASCFHAGWRGYTDGIQQNALSQMWTDAERKGTNRETWLRSLRVTIGPAICGRSYPCGQDVFSSLESHLEQRLRPLEGWTDECEELFVSATAGPRNAGQDILPEGDKIYPDLQSLMILELHAYGLKLNQVAVFREDTYLSSWWPSHRRAMAEGLEKAGRLVTHLCPPACPQVQNHDSNL
jgi:copper oxidase (laccase) domain-containing protein